MSDGCGNGSAVRDQNVQINCMAPGPNYTHMTDQILAAGNRAVSPPALGPNRGGPSQPVFGNECVNPRVVRFESYLGSQKTLSRTTRR